MSVRRSRAVRAPFNVLRQRGLVVGSLIGAAPSCRSVLAISDHFGHSALVVASADAEQYRALMRLGATLALGALQAEDAVELATSLVAAGSDSGPAMELASMPSNPKQLSVYDVEPMARDMLADFGIAVPSKADAGWTVAGFIAEAMIAGAIDPPTGALRLWSLWDVCGEPNDELTWMLQLHDAWEESVGERRAAIEAEMIDYAPTVVVAARRHAAA